MKRLEDKVILIAGGAGGIGSIAADICQSEGAKVIVADIKEPFSMEYVKTDVTDSESCRNAVDYVINKYGRIDAGISMVDKKGDLLHDIAHMEWDNFADVWKTNVQGSWNFAKAVSAQMVPNRYGVIILRGSAEGTLPSGTAYGPAKNAVAAMAVGLTNELGRYNVRVNTVSPLITAEEAEEIKVTEAGEQIIANLLSRIPGGRLPKNENVAWAVVNLIEDRFLTTASIDLFVDGGYVRSGKIDYERGCQCE